MKFICRTCKKEIEGIYHSKVHLINVKTGEVLENSAIHDDGFCMLTESLKSYKQNENQHDQK